MMERNVDTVHLSLSLSLSLSFKHTLNSHNDDPHSGTPGMVMSIYALLSKNSTPSKEDVEQFCQGNICRCTGYASIYKAARAAVSSSSKTMKNASTASTTTRKKLHARMPRKSIIKNNDSTTTYVNAVTLDDVFQILESYGPAESSSSLRLVVGNTSKGVVKYYSPQNSDKPSMFCDISRIPELLNINTDSSGITFGAAVTLTNMISSLEKLVSKGGMYTKRGSGPYSSMPNFIRHLKLVAHPQVRDVSSWTGNMMLAKAHPNFPSDVVVVLIAANASLTLLDSKGVCVCVFTHRFLCSCCISRKTTHSSRYKGKHRYCNISQDST
jgi:xanthine dehydrogenase/oxidase